MLSERFGAPNIRPFMKDSWAIGWPMILIMSFQFAVGITDVYVAGYIGTKVLAAVGYVGQLYWTLMILANGITVGTVALVSQAYGAGASRGVGRIATHSMTLGVIIAGLLTAAIALNPEAIVRIAGMPSEIQEIAEDFIRIFSLVLVPTYLSIITAGVLRASGRVRIAMFNAFAAALVNVGGDFILAFGWGPIPALGYRGIAIATALAMTTGMLLNTAHMCLGPTRVQLRAFLNPIGRCFRNLVKVGAPSAVQHVAWNAGTLVVYFLVGLLDKGEITALAALTAGLRIEALIFLPIFAFNMTAAVVTGNRLGARDPEGAKSGAKAAAVLCLGIILIPAAGIFASAPHLAALLTDDPAVLAEMTRYLRINMVAVPFMAVGVTLLGALQGAGDTFAAMRIIITAMWIVRIPLILGVAHATDVGAVGIWWCMTVSMAALCGLTLHRFIGEKWMRASRNKTGEIMLWEACQGEPAGETRRHIA